MCKINSDSTSILIGSQKTNQVTTIDGSQFLQMLREGNLDPGSIQISDKGIATFQNFLGNSFRSELTKEQVAEFQAITNGNKTDSHLEHQFMDGTAKYNMKYNATTLGKGFKLFETKSEMKNANTENPPVQYTPEAKPQTGSSEANLNLFDEVPIDKKTVLHSQNIIDKDGMIFETGYGRRFNNIDSNKDWKLKFEPNNIPKDFNTDIKLKSSHIDIEIKNYEWNDNENRPITYQERYNKETGQHDLTDEQVMHNRLLLEIYHPKFIQPATEPDNIKALQFIDEPTNTFNFSKNFKKNADPPLIKEKPQPDGN